MFSERDLKVHDEAIYVNRRLRSGPEFHWDFHATLRKDGSGGNDARRRDLVLTAKKAVSGVPCTHHLSGDEWPVVR